MGKFGCTLQINQLPGRETQSNFLQLRAARAKFSGQFMHGVQQGCLVVAGQGFNDNLLDFFELQGFGNEAVEGIGQDFLGADVAR